MPDHDEPVSAPATVGVAGGVTVNVSILVTFAVAVVVASTWILVRLLGPIGFSADEWMLVADRREWSVDAVMSAHNGHPAIIPAVAYLIGFRTVGLDGMWFYKALLISIHLGVCALVAHRVWRRHGAVVATAAWALVCFMGAGAQNVVQLFQIGMDGSVLCFLVSLVVLDRLLSSGRSRDALLLSLTVTVSIAFASVGLSVLAAVGVVLAMDRRTWPHLWSVAAPAALYLAWRQVYGEHTDASGNPGVLLRFIWAAVRTSGAAIGFGSEVLGAALVAAVFWVLVRRAARERAPILLAAPAFVVSFWLVTAVGRAETQLAFGDISPSRYRYVAVVGLVVALGDLVVGPDARGHEHGMSRRLVPGLIAGAAAVTSVWVGHAELITERDMFANWTRISESRLAVVDAHPRSVPGDAWVDPMLATMNPARVTVSDYLDASISLDTRAGMSPSEFAAVPRGLLLGAEELILPLLETEEDPSTACTRGGDAPTEFVLEPGHDVRVEVGASGALLASRWLDPAPGGSGSRTLAPGRWRVSTPADDLPGAWTISFGGDVRMLDCP